MVQVNTPYPAVPVLCGFLKSHGIETAQADLSLAVALALFTRSGVRKASAEARRKTPTALTKFFLANAEAYADSIESVVAFLQGRRPESAWRFCHRGVLPEGPHFRELDESGAEEDFGLFGIEDKAKRIASLFLDDLAEIFQETLDPAFSFARYAEHLALAAPSFDPLQKRLSAKKLSTVDTLIDGFVRDLLAKHKPLFVGVTAPFPGTVYGAFRVAASVRKYAPGVKTVLGGGYVNSELQHLSDERVFDYFDFICFGEGFAPWLGLAGKGPMCRTRSRTSGGMDDASHCGGGSYAVPVSDYTGVDFSKYISLAETSNPMHRLWSDGRWLKVQLANGCYWHRCAFCDVALDYIARYAPAKAEQAVASILKMRDATGISAFHFTDEAIPPALVRAVSSELIRRKADIVWWGNIRLDESFTEELCGVMAAAGCVGISAGLECAQDRLLKLMNKGITCASARTVCGRLTDAGILTHLYLMYGFPTETVKETKEALRFVRDLFRDGLVQSAFWHRFALTVHSPIAKNPERFGIKPRVPDLTRNCFALNEIGYDEPGAPDHAALGKGLSLAVYNYMQGRGLDLPISFWFQKNGAAAD